jgi:hypothetical protein
MSKMIVLSRYGRKKSGSRRIASSRRSIAFSGTLRNLPEGERAKTNRVFPRL